MGNYIDPADVSNWPSGYTDEMKAEDIARIEELVEKTLKTFFYTKALDIKLNGNNKDRIFLPVEANILTVSKVFVNGVELAASWYTWDHSSVFIDLTTSGSGSLDPELSYMLRETSIGGLFPAGFDNIRIKGTYGYSSVPENIKKLCIILVEYESDPDLYTTWLYDSEKIGDYSYSKGASGKGIPSIFGIWEADRIAVSYRRQKKTRILTTR